MLSQEENMVLVQEFLEKADHRVLVIAASQQGQLTPAYTFPPSSKTKVGPKQTTMFDLAVEDVHGIIVCAALWFDAYSYCLILKESNKPYKTVPVSLEIESKSA